MEYNISYKTLVDVKPVHIRYDKEYGLMSVYNGTEYWKVFELGKYNEIVNSIR